MTTLLRAASFLAPLLFAPSLNYGAGVGTGLSRNGDLADQLTLIRNQVILLEQSLVEGVHSRKRAKGQVKKIRKLLDLQKEERNLGQARLAELEKTVMELESRRSHLGERMQHQQHAIRHCLIAIEISNRGESAKRLRSLHLPEQEKLEAPRRRVLANLVDRGLKEVETLRADLADAAHLEARIQEEKSQLTYVFQDLKEQESVLELNRQLQVDLIKKNRNERIVQLENYRKLKSAEGQVEHLIKEFSARMELERTQQAERAVSKAMMLGEFAQLKGKLQLPVSGRILSTFGRAYDPKSRLYIFKKGVDIDASKNQEVKAISAGKIAFSGVLPNYGKVVIVDHGGHFYSLYAHLGATQKKTNEAVRAGDSLGLTGDSKTPLYFEIRARNVAVNPLQWVSN